MATDRMLATAQMIAEETRTRANTAARVGNLFIDIVRYFDACRLKDESYSQTETNAEIKKQVDALNTALAGTLSAMQRDIRTLSTSKANIASTLAGYGITDAFTKIETSNLLTAMLSETEQTLTTGLTAALNTPTVNLDRLNTMGLGTERDFYRVLAAGYPTRTRWAITYNSKTVGLLDVLCEDRTATENVVIVHQRAMSCYDIPTVDTVMKAPTWEPQTWKRTFYSIPNTSKWGAQYWHDWTKVE